jgi:prephenate dehydrogenase
MIGPGSFLAMSADFSNVTILGGGLLGGSLALALQDMENPPQVRLWARRPATAETARELGIRHATSDLAEAVKHAELLVLAVPVGSMASLVSDAIAVNLPAGCLITDVGSVKTAPHAEIAPLLAGRPLEFIGSHPMAGSEQGGISAASARLFEDAACLLTNDAHVCQEKADALERFWNSVGCRSTWMSAAGHDELVARISHLPHVVAACAARVCLLAPSDGQFGGGGLRDTTRVASGNPEMWAEILTENRAALLGPLRETLADLGEFIEVLENAEQEAARQWLATAKDRRDFLNSSC